ncbi:hypothetical protein RD792_014141 [Penstemon davidsonii]|uniref:RNA polymerase sigma-70 domain-containing protein n=1 Tax=Penstemon davidsonii TaxID=160366 RepID=A0ABR0CNH7_9LAMI|nr:hypothetical protein RD792_014141 [Penstemon davidsonii]
MEVGRSLISSTPLRNHFRNCSPSSPSSVLLLHEKVTPALTSLSTTSLVRHPPTSVLIQDQRDESRALLSLKEDITLPQMVDRRLVVEAPTSTSDEADNNLDPDQYLDGFQLQLLRMPELRWPSLHREEQSFPITTESISTKSEIFNGIEANHVVALAKEALSACKEAASIANDTKLFEACFDNSSSLRSSTNTSVQKIVRSTRLLERQTKRRRVPNSNVDAHETIHHRKPESHRNIGEGFANSDPLRLFLGGPETTQLLTAKEEAELIVNIQELMRLQEVRTRLENEFSREPTIVEWAAAIGISCQALKSKIHSGKSSRDKLIYSNLRMVVHIAKQYQGRGLNLQDMLQEGSMGLMRSVEKFKPQAGCRFATYAYWWIRQSIRKALFQHSRTVRLPEITADNSVETPDMGVGKQVMRQHVRNLLSVLNPRERKIIRLRFGIEDGNQKSLSEIGACFGLSKERVRQLESRALNKLKQCLVSQGLAAYTDMVV